MTNVWVADEYSGGTGRPTPIFREVLVRWCQAPALGTSLRPESGRTLGELERAAASVNCNRRRTRFAHRAEH